MSDANVVKLLQPGSFADPLTEVLRNGARALLAQAIEAEVAEFLAKHADLKTDTGLRRVVRHGHLPEREVMTGIGPVGVRQPRVRDRGAADDAGRIRFTPAILPPYARRSRSLEVLIPILYLKGISTGDFEEALAALLGKDAPGLSASTIARLKEVWLDEHEHWRKRDLSAKRYVYVWADGIYLQARLEDAEAMHPGHHRRDAGGQEGAARLHRRRARERPGLAGAAARFEEPRSARSRPNSPSPTARSASGRRSARCGRPHASNAAGCTRPPTSSTNCRRASSRRPSGHCRKSGWPRPARTPRPRSTPSSQPTRLKYEKAAECLAKDRQALLAFYDFPAEHWKHLRTSNPIESTFATVRHRTIRSKGCLSNKTALAMVFKLVDAAQKSWRRLVATTSCPSSFKVSGSPTGSKSSASQAQTLPPEPCRHQDSAIAHASLPSP